MQDRTSYLSEIIDKTWKKEIESCTKKEDSSKSQSYHLLKVLLRCFGKPLLLIGIAEGFMELFSRYVIFKLRKISFDYIFIKHLIHIKCIVKIILKLFLFFNNNEMIYNVLLKMRY